MFFMRNCFVKIFLIYIINDVNVFFIFLIKELMVFYYKILIYLFRIY